MLPVERGKAHRTWESSNSNLVVENPPMQTSQRPAPSQWLSVEGRDQKMHRLEAHTQETNASVQLGPAPHLQPRTMPPLEVEGSGASLHPASTQAQMVSLERSRPQVEKEDRDVGDAGNCRKRHRPDAREVCNGHVEDATPS